MAKGRKGKAPGLQKDLGDPGKRGKTKVEKQLAEAEQLAKLLATAPGQENNALSPPLFLDQRFAPALAVWNEYAPRLAHLNMLDPVYRHTFAAFCVWMGEFLIANEAIAKDGFAVKVRTVSGDRMWRENPNVSRRETAMKFVMQLSERFGFTPLDQHKLVKEMGSSPLGHGTLFDNQRGGKAPAESEDTAIGAMDDMDSHPPEAKLN